MNFSDIYCVAFDVGGNEYVQCVQAGSEAEAVEQSLKGFEHVEVRAVVNMTGGEL